MSTKFNLWDAMDYQVKDEVLFLTETNSHDSIIFQHNSLDLFNFQVIKGSTS